MSGADTDPIPQRGSIETNRPEAVLRFCERVHFSGTLSFESSAGKGVLPVLDGIPEIDDGDDGRVQAALDEFVACTAGSYSLHQILPHLADTTRDGDLALEGDITVGAIPGLMRYCETAGITGTLRIERDGHRCDARYLGGDLVSITVDREEDAQLEHVFGWNDGRFRIEAKPLFADADRISAPEPQLLQTLEVALTEIMDQRARRESTSLPPSPFRAPSLRNLEGVAFGVERIEGATPAPASSTGSHPRVGSAPPRRSLGPNADGTVKVFYVSRESIADRPSATQHAASGGEREELDLDLASRKHASLSVEKASAAVSDSARASVPRVNPAASAGTSVTPWTIGFGAVAAGSVIVAIVILWGLLSR